MSLSDTNTRSVIPENRSLPSLLFHLSRLLSSNPTVWYKCQIKAFFYLVFGGMATAYAFQLFARSVGTLIQTSSKAQPTHWMDEIKHTVVGFGMTVASISAWPMMMYELGMETAIRWDLNECGVFGSPALYILKALVGLVAPHSHPPLPLLQTFTTMPQHIHTFRLFSHTLPPLSF